MDENSIKHKLLNCNETKIYQDSNNEIKKIKFNNQLSTSDKQIIEKFINNILSPVISESNILWTSKFVLNEIGIFYPLEKSISDSMKQLTVLSPANPILKYFREYSYHKLFVPIYHFWYESKQEDISWGKIAKIIKCHTNVDDLKKYQMKHY